MSLPLNYLYEFGDFCLDVEEKILSRDGEVLELTPKGFELLSIFVENQGKLLKKENLMDSIWADSFVEESNLTFNIGQLRKLLGDGAHQPKYIKTVRGHGYRFITDVRRVPREDQTLKAPDVEEVPARPADGGGSVPSAPVRQRTMIATGILIAIVLSGAVWILVRLISDDPVKIAESEFSSEKLTNSGTAATAVIAPDGKYVVYAAGLGSERGSVWLRHLDTGSVVEIIPPSDNRYYGLALSPDGTILYFVRRPLKSSEPAGIFRVPVFGGVPQKLATDTEGWMSVSPDGKLISFVRCTHTDLDNCSLWIANSADGSNPRRIVTRPKPFRIDDNRFSPDGQSIGFAVGQSSTASNEFAVHSVDIETGVESELTPEKFFNVKNLIFLDGGELLITASRVPTKNFRIWRIIPDKKAEPLTDDADSYSVLSVDHASSKIISTRINQDFRMYVSKLEDPTVGKKIAVASAGRFSPDGRIYFQSIQSGNDEVWSMLPDGSGQQQLTNDPADDGRPLPSRDGKTIFFVSNRSASAQIWRMNPDGTDQAQVSMRNGGAPYESSADQRWVFFRQALDGTIWKVPYEGGEPQPVTKTNRTNFAISPDSTQAAVFKPEGSDDQYQLVDLSTGEALRVFKTPNPELRIRAAAWLPDGSAFLIAACEIETRNCALWKQHPDGSEPKRIKTLEDLDINDLSVSADGKLIAIAQGRWTHDIVLLKGLK